MMAECDKELKDTTLSIELLHAMEQQDPTAMVDNFIQTLQSKNQKSAGRYADINVRICNTLTTIPTTL